MELVITLHLSNTSFFFFLDKQADSLFLIILCCLFKSFACKISNNKLNNYGKLVQTHLGNAHISVLDMYRDLTEIYMPCMSQVHMQ